MNIITFQAISRMAFYFLWASSGNIMKRLTLGTTSILCPGLTRRGRGAHPPGSHTPAQELPAPAPMRAPLSAGEAPPPPASPRGPEDATLRPACGRPAPCHPIRLYCEACRRPRPRPRGREKRRKGAPSCEAPRGGCRPGVEQVLGCRCAVQRAGGIAPWPLVAGLRAPPRRRSSSWQAAGFGGAGTSRDACRGRQRPRRWDTKSAGDTMTCSRARASQRGLPASAGRPASAFAYVVSGYLQGAERRAPATPVPGGLEAPSD